MTTRHFAAAIGFAFVVCWITLGFGWAVLALVGAVAFYGVGVLLERGIGLGDLQRLAGERAERAAPSRVR